MDLSLIFDIIRDGTPVMYLAAGYILCWITTRSDLKKMFDGLKEQLEEMKEKSSEEHTLIKVDIAEIKQWINDQPRKR